jgi:hypothetical protein
MKSHRMMIVMMAAMSLASVSFADDKPTTGRPVKPVSWEELQGRCQDPNNYQDLQGVLPTNIQIECTNVVRTWVQSEPGVVPLAADRGVAAAVSATKFTVNSESRALGFPGENGACPRFKEVVRTSNIVVPVSCGQVMGFKGKPVDFCQGIFDSGKGQGPKETVTRETGRVIDSCAGIPGAGGTGGGKPKPDSLE